MRGCGGVGAPPDGSLRSELPRSWGWVSGPVSPLWSSELTAGTDFCLRVTISLCRLGRDGNSFIQKVQSNLALPCWAPHLRRAHFEDVSFSYLRWDGGEWSPASSVEMIPQGFLQVCFSTGPASAQPWGRQNQLCFFCISLDGVPLPVGWQAACNRTLC